MDRTGIEIQHLKKQRAAGEGRETRRWAKGGAFMNAGETPQRATQRFVETLARL